jgi:outer membrane receptor protein involved in Fe transport
VVPNSEAFLGVLVTYRSKINRSLLRGSSALSALTMLGAGLAVSTFVAAPAVAQDYTSGAITGTVTDDAGAPVEGATVTATSVEQGFERTSTTTASGTYRFNGLPQGSYNIVVSAEGRPNFRADAVSVQASQTATIPVQLAAAGGEEIVVTGTRAVQDFATNTTGLNLDVAELVKTVPINRDVTSVILLAPGTTLGDDAFQGADGSALTASVGGSSVAENAYYINGLNITNFDNYLGGSDVPFEFYRNIETKIGGIPAEFGRATGGIINAVSKSGSNDFTAALHLNWTPDFLRSPGKNLLTCDEDGNCERRTDRGFDSADTLSAIVEAGGPIIRDRLFVYGLTELRRSRSLITQDGLSQDRRSDDPFYAIKVDAFPIDSQHLEFTLFDTRRTTRRTTHVYEMIGGQPNLGVASSIVDLKRGGVSFVGKYTGTFTDWLTVSAAYGRNRDRFDSIGLDEGSNYFAVRNETEEVINGAGYFEYLTGQPSPGRDFPYETEREFYRGDVDLFFNLFGDHHIRAGFDVENNTLSHTSIRTGGDLLFNELGFITADAYNAGPGGAGLFFILRPGNTVELNYYNSGGSFEAVNRAFYIQDEWNVTDRLTLNLGVRRDDFRVDKPGNIGFVNLKENYAPRVGFSYDMFEGNRGRLFGSYSWYYLPVASNTAYRNAGSEFYFRERWLYNGFDENGLPILTTQRTDVGTYQTACPFRLTPLSSGQNCAVTGDGSVKPTDAFLSQTLEATRQSEFILGYEHRIGQWRVGLSYTHRNLDVSAEDVAIDAAVNAYCEEEGLDCTRPNGNPIWTGFHQYVLLNPGKDLTIVLSDPVGGESTRRTVTFSAEDLGYPEAKRKFDAVTLQFDRPFDGKWSLGGSYTWSKSRGNSEGFVQSDFEQSDSGVTQDFDQPGFIPGAYGYLPNDRRHRFRLYGGYALNDALTLGANVLVDSPRPLSCIGYNPTDVFANGYDQASHYCGGVLSPRGTAQRTQWLSQIDISARYNLNLGDDRVVTLRADVFNLLNSQSVTGRNEIGDLGVETDPDTDLPISYTPNPNYGQPDSYQRPRYVRLGVDISF